MSGEQRDPAAQALFDAQCQEIIGNREFRVVLDRLIFTSQIIAERVLRSGVKEYLVTWDPPNEIPDEWHPEGTVPVEKAVPARKLSHETKKKLEACFNSKIPDRPIRTRPGNRRRKAKKRSSQI